MQVKREEFMDRLCVGWCGTGTIQAHHGQTEGGKVRLEESSGIVTCIT